MIKLIVVGLITYLVYKYFESKNYEMPLMSWVGLGFLLCWIF